MGRINLFITLLIFCLQSSLYGQNTVADSLQSQLENFKTKDTSYINLVNKIAESLVVSNPDRSLEFTAISERLSDSLDFLKGKAVSLLISGKSYREKYEYQKSLDIFKRSINTYQKIGDKWAIGVCRYEMAFDYFYMGDFPKAIEYFYDSRNIGLDFDNKRHVVNCLKMMGIIYRMQGNFPKAVEDLQNALLVAELIDEKLFIADVCNELGIVYLKQSNREMASASFERARRIYEDAGEKGKLGSLYNNLGLISEEENKPEEALALFKQALEISQHTGNKFERQEFLNNIGNIYKKQGKYQAALEQFKNSVEISNEVGSKNLISAAYLSIGEVYLKQGNLAQANDYTLRSLDISVEMRFLELQRKAYEQLSDISSLRGDHKRSLEYYKDFKRLNDSIFNDETKKRSIALEFEYKYEKEKQAERLARQEQELKDAEQKKRERLLLYSTIGGLILVTSLLIVALYYYFDKRKTNLELVKQKREIEEKSKELVTLNATKDKLFSIIAYDIRDPFNNIINLSSILARETANLDPEVLTNFLESINTSANYAYDLLSNLIDWASSQTNKISSSSEKISIKSIFLLANDNIERVAKNKEVVLNYTSEDIEVTIDKHMVNTILRNLVRNAVKYSYRGGEVKIEGFEDDDMLHISVADQGVGIEKERLEKIFNIEEKTNTPGTENESGSGLGLLLCKEFVERMGGKIYAQSEPGKGSKFTFTVPLG